MSTKTRPYTRGMYYKHPSWSKDMDVAYYQGFTLKVAWPLIKLAVMTLLYLGLNQWYSNQICILILLLIIWFYQDVVALFSERIRMSSMDS